MVTGNVKAPFSIDKNITTTEDILLDSAIKVLIYGDSGIGKTMLCATAPKPFLISAESGLLSLKNKNIARVFGPDTEDVTYNIPTVIISEYDDILDIYQWCVNSEEASNYKTICIDSLSEIAELVLIREKNKFNDPRRGYGEMLDKMGGLIRAFRDLRGKHVYMSAKMEPFKNELTGITKYGVGMPGTKLGQKAPYYFDEVFRMGFQGSSTGGSSTGGSYRFLQTSIDMQYEAKDRSGMLNPIEEPFLAKIFKKITGDES